MSRRKADTPVTKVEVSCYQVPTDAPEGDGTFDWDSTTMLLVRAMAGDSTGLGYSYTGTAAASLIRATLAKHVEGRDAFDIPGAHAAMLHAIRNLGRPGIVATAIAAVDNALWDLKCRLLNLSLLDLLGAARDAAPVYGSGGFTTYTDDQLRAQLGGWAKEGFKSVKMKLGKAPTRAAELARVRGARECIGPKVELYVDANGAYDRKTALMMAHLFQREYDVRWFEEPVSSDDLEGLHLLRNQGPGGMQIAAGEYGYDLYYFHRMLQAQAVDTLQADATRCLGITGFLRVGALCEAFNVPFSFHCAPALHASPACSLPGFVIGEYFHDHARIENLFFDGTPQPQDGCLRPDRSRPGLGLEFKAADAEKFCVT